MAFKVSSQTAQEPVAAQTGPKPLGGRYAGIRPRPPSLNKVKQGEYVLEGVKSVSSRSGTTAMLHVRVRQAEVDSVTTPSDEPRLVMINFGGKSWDAGSARLVALAMAICKCETVDQFWAEEPHGDELIDILSGKRESSEHYGSNPIEGRLFYARGRNSTKLSDDGEPFINWEFGSAAE